MLTNAAVKAARPRASGYKISDERGLHLFVSPTGARSFRLRFRYRGHEQLLTIGQWPEVSLADARARAELAREQLARGLDPRALPKAMTFEAAARAWHAHRVLGWTEIHAADVLASLVADVFPAIGAEALANIDSPAVLRAMRAIEARGAVETARRVRQRVSDVFAFAISEGWCAENPAAIVARAMKATPSTRRQPALGSIEAARELLAAVDAGSGATAVKLASSFLALTGVRLAAVRGARWGEIEDLDGAAPLWRVPAARVKLPAAKKLDASNDHLVPLSPAAVELLRAARGNMHRHDADMHEGTSDGTLLFSGVGRGGMIGEGAIGALYDAAGFAGRHVPHGWRATFSTVMNDRYPEHRTAIDRVLGHAVKGEDGKVAKVEAAYNRAQLLDQRRWLLEQWAELLLGID